METDMLPWSVRALLVYCDLHAGRLTLHKLLELGNGLVLLPQLEVRLPLFHGILHDSGMPRSKKKAARRHPRTKLANVVHGSKLQFFERSPCHVIQAGLRRATD
jgi:hypothetical protein